jgi:hypothetical protein
LSAGNDEPLASPPVPVLDAAALHAALNCVPYPNLKMTAAQLLAQGSLAPGFLAAAIRAYLASPPVSAPQVGRPAILDEIAKGLEGVTPGPWSWGAKFLSRKEPAENYTPFAECLPGEYDSSQWCRNAAHLSRLSPDNVRTVLDYAAQVEARLSDLHGVLADLAEADDAIVAWTKGSRPVEELTDLEDRLGEAIRACTKAYRASLQP